MPQKNRKAVEEEFFLLYTAMSRKSHSLVLVQVISVMDLPDD